MHGSVIGVGRVISRLHEAKEGMAVRRVKVEVADQTELMKEMEAEGGETVAAGESVE